MGSRSFLAVSILLSCHLCNRDGVPKVTELFAINEKWLLVKCMKRFFFVCV